MTAGADLPLLGVRVVDLTSNIAGPYGAAVLADLGADVVHVEPPAGDGSRNMAPTTGDSSAYFHVVNRGKRLTTLDLGRPEGLEELHRMIDEADVLVTNLKLAKLTSLGLTAAEVRRRWPRLVYGQLTAYGPRGADAQRPGYDAVVQARTGLCAVTGTPESGPVRVGVSILDMGAGIWLALGVVAGLLHRATTGEGVEIGTSLFETGAAWSSYHVAAHGVTGRPSAPAGSGHPAFAPYGLFEAEDGQVAIGVNNDAQFRRLCAALGAPELGTDERFATNAGRLVHSSALRARIERRLTDRPTAYWIDALSAADVPADRLQLPEALLVDPQVQELDLLVEVAGDDPNRPLVFPGLPVRWEGRRPRGAAQGYQG